MAVIMFFQKEVADRDRVWRVERKLWNPFGGIERHCGRSETGQYYYIGSIARVPLTLMRHELRWRENETEIDARK